jgi:hypothetical protein
MKFVNSTQGKLKFNTILTEDIKMYIYSRGKI